MSETDKNIIEESEAKLEESSMNLMEALWDVIDKYMVLKNYTSGKETVADIVNEIIGDNKEMTYAQQSKLPKNLPNEIKNANKILEKMYIWTEASLFPSIEIYTIKEVEKPGIPYPQFVPEKVVIVSKHSNGVDQGYSYEIYRPIIKNEPRYGERSVTITYEQDFIWSPLVLSQAKLLCRNLNRQMKDFYLKAQKEEKNNKK